MRRSRSRARLGWWVAALTAAALFGCDAPAPTAGPPGATDPPVTTSRPSASGPAPSAAGPAGAPPHARPGRIEERQFASAALGVAKRYLVYVPDTYASETERYPVVYLLHGLGGDETNWSKHGDLLRVADGMGLRALVVMPDGDAGFYVDGSAPTDYPTCLGEKPPFSAGEPPDRYCVKSPRYESYVAQDLVAHVDKSYRTIASREGRGIGGLSMGGFGALVLAMRHDEVFSAAASTSGLISLRYAGPHPYQGIEKVATADPPKWGADYPERVRNHLLGVLGPSPTSWRALDPVSLAESLEPGRLALHIDCGEEDDFRFDDHARHLHDVLGARRIDHEFVIVPGRHLFDYWKARLPDLLVFFRKSLGEPR